MNHSPFRVHMYPPQPSDDGIDGVLADVEPFRQSSVGQILTYEGIHFIPLRLGLLDFCDAISELPELTPGKAMPPAQRSLGDVVSHPGPNLLSLPGRNLDFLDLRLSQQGVRMVLASHRHLCGSLDVFFAIHRMTLNFPMASFTAALAASLSISRVSGISAIRWDNGLDSCFSG